MKELLQQYATYNKWANGKMIEAIVPLPAETIDKTVESSFPSLRLTLTHLWVTEYTWWQRLHLAENIVSPAQDKVLSIETIVSEWKQQSLHWQQWVMNAKEVQLNHVFAYMNSKKEQFKQPVYEVLLHLFNHGTYHRGQLVTILRQLGIDKIPATDFIVWSRSKK